MIDPFRPDNGATRFVAGSQRGRGAGRRAAGSATRTPAGAAVRDAGSLLVFNGSTWHGHAANVSEEPRRSLQGAFIPRGGERDRLRRPDGAGNARAADPTRAASARALTMWHLSFEPAKIKSFRRAGVEAWLSKHHDRETEIWLKVHKKIRPGVGDLRAALDSALCWGWIRRHPESFDERSFLQRYTPRKAKSIWSRSNATTSPG